MYCYTLFVSAGILVSAALPSLPTEVWVYSLLWGALIGLTLALCLYLYSPYISTRSYLTSFTARMLKSRVWLCGLCLLLGFSYGVIANTQLLQKQLPNAWDRQLVTVVGVVIDLPVNSLRRQRLLLEYHYLNFEDLTAADKILAQASVPTTGKLWLSWYKPNSDLQVGQRWLFKVRLRAPRGFVNPAGFDYQSWLLRKGVTATGTIKQGELENSNAVAEHLVRPQSLSERSFLSLVIGIAKARDYLRRRLDEAGERGLIKQARLMKALIIADKSALTTTDWRLLQNTGTAHLMAISGLHIGLVALLGYYLGALIGRLVNLLWVNINSLSIADFSAAVMACAYAALAGFSTPTLRALIMVVSVQIFLRLSRIISKREAMSFALFAVVLVDPMAYWDMGFWMSFLAAGVLVMIYSGRQRFSRPRRLPVGEAYLQDNTARKPNVMTEALRSQWYLFFALLMPVLWLVKRVSLLTPLANVVAIPVVALLVAPLLLLAVLLESLGIGHDLALYPLILGDMTLSLLWDFLALLESFSAAVVVAATPTVAPTIATTAEIPQAYMSYLQGGQLLSGDLIYLALAAGLLGVLLILLPRAIPGRLLGYPLLLMAMVSGHLSGTSLSGLGLLGLSSSGSSQMLKQGLNQALKLTFFDVGQGMAVAVETNGKLLIYDAGPNYSEKFNAGQAIVSPYLDGRGKAHIDTLVISHADSDHSGGAAELSQRHPVDLLLAPQALVDCISLGQKACLPAAWHVKRRDSINQSVNNKTANSRNVNSRKANNERHSLLVRRTSSCSNLIKWRWGITEFKVFSAQTAVGPRLKRLRLSGRNNSSCLLQIEHAGVRLLLTGDIEAMAERALLDSDLLPASLDWMSVPHHGSKTSSSQLFIEHLQPRQVIFQYGHNNAYHHPNKAVVARYQALGSRMFNVDELGAIQLVIAASGQTQITRWRRDHARFWYGVHPASEANQ